MGLQFASERFFQMAHAHTHTHTNTDTLKRTQAHQIIARGNKSCLWGNESGPEVTNPSSDGTILSSKVINFSTMVMNFAFFVTNLSTHEY